MSNLSNLLHRLVQEETGAVTVDWVALTAGIVVAGLFIASVVMGGAESVTDKIVLELEGITLPYSTAGGDGDT